MIKYINQNTKEILYDTNMLRETLGMSKSQLIREMKKYNFSESEYVHYKNQFLFKENSVIEFITFLVMNRLVKDIDRTKKEVDKMKSDRNGLHEN